MFSEIGLKLHCVKSVQIRSFLRSVFSRTRTKYGDLRSTAYAYHNNFPKLSLLNYYQKGCKLYMFLRNCFKYTLREKCPNTEFFLVRSLSHSDWIQTRKISAFGHFSRSDMILKRSDIADRSLSIGISHVLQGPTPILLCIV